MDIFEIRHHLHQIAERSGEEKNTKNYILDNIKQLQTSKIREIEGTNGLLVEYSFGEIKKTILFRADIDALQAKEVNDINYKSNNENVAHLCGHDGHTSILLYCAYLLSEKPLKDIRVLLLFQPSEEDGKGANQVINSCILNNYKIDSAFAIHNIPSYEKGLVLLNNKSFTCAVVSCDMVFNGKTSHAAEPENSVSPFDIMLQTKQLIEKMEERDFEDDNYFLATLIEFDVGSQSYGVAAGKGVLRFTFRAKKNDVLDTKCREIEDKTKELVQKTKNISLQIRYLERFYANENNQESVSLIEKAAKEENLKHMYLENAFRWGEDFGLITKNIKGAMFGVGSGEDCSPLHSPTYNFPDEIIIPTAKLFYRIAEDFSLE
jgi:amidohydrolase